MKMGFIQGLERTLDRPGGRRILKALKSWNARRQVWSYWFHVYRPSRGDTIVDVGAGLGLQIPVFSSCVGSKGRVVAIEANPITFNNLQELVQRKRLTNVIACKNAIVDRARTVYIENKPHHEANVIDLVSPHARSGLAVEGLSLDELCLAHGVRAIDFLKMNIEGAERLAIRGMDDMIKKTRYLCIACHDFLGGEEFRTRQIIVDFLRGNGFRVIERSDHPYPWVACHIHGINERLPRET